MVDNDVGSGEDSCPASTSGFRVTVVHSPAHYCASRVATAVLREAEGEGKLLTGLEVPGRGRGSPVLENLTMAKAI